MQNYISMIFSHNEPFEGKTAIVDNDGARAVSWAEFYKNSQKIAAYAVSCGLKGLVPVCMPRCAEALEVLFGLGWAGLGVAPLSEHTPEARVTAIEAQSGNKAKNMAWYLEAMTYTGAPVPAAEFSKEEPAYVVFTSGSTGEPKGVMLSDTVVRAAIRRLSGPEFLNLHPGERVMQHASFSFVALMMDVYAALYAGTKIYILPEEAHADADRVTDFINTHSITATFAVPKLLKQLGSMPSVKTMITGSERVSGIAPNGYRLINGWGMSETCALATSYEIRESSEQSPIGFLCPEFRGYVLDDEGNIAEEGELCVSGAISMGYYKRPDLTEQFFEPNPFSTDEGHKTLLHTGDIVKRLPDGSFMYINRKDFMIKINGQRVEPGESETILRRLPGIRDAAVKGFTEPDGHSYLCAYYVSDGAIGEEEIRAALEKELPAYMVPAFYTKLCALPLNANGKLDRKALPAPETAALHADYAAPRTEEERLLCRAFREALHVDRVGLDDDFFRLGGDSIRTMQVVKLADLPGLSVADVLSGRTPRRVAAGYTGAHEDIYASAAEKPDCAPLTESQMGIYLECAAAPGSLKYNIPFRFSFARAEYMTAAYVKSCVDTVIALHPALYARIAARNGEIVMLREPMPAGGLCVAEERETELADEWAGFVHPFDLAAEPPCRVKAVLTKEKVHIYMDTHHVVSDGTSVAALINGITEAMAGQRPEGEKVDAFALYAIEKKRGEANAEAAKAHFGALLGGVETDSNLLFDKKSDATDAPAERVTLTVENLDLSQAHRQGISTSTLFMSVFGYTLAKMTGQTESLFAAAESGRKSGALEHTVSMMVRTLPVYMRIDEKKNAFASMKELRDSFYASVKNDTASFRELANEYGIKADVMFVYQSDMLSGKETALGPVETEFYVIGRAISNFNVSVFKENGRFRVVFEYRGDLYTKATAERFAYIYKNALYAFAADVLPETVPLLSEKDKTKLDAQNKTESPFNDKETIVDIFLRRAAGHPQKTALIYTDRKYTYAETEDITRRLAGYIRSLGIKKGQTVSVLIDRSEYMFIAAMGSMRAGAVYQPLDPSYPADRLSFMRKDASSALLIADRALLPLLPDFEGRVLYTDEIPTLPAYTGALPLPAPEDGYILLYTSGTTGLPKGCLLKHLNLTALVHAYADLTKMDESSIAGAYASYGFDAHMADMYPVISVGGTVVIVPNDIRLDLPAVKEYIEEKKVSHLILTTQLAVQFVLQYKKLTYLKCLLTGGEKLVSLEPPVSYSLINAYGPTECTVMETSFTVDKVYEDIPIGTAIENTKLYVSDAANRRLPVGVPGELLIAGPQVACEYINRPEQTAKAFITNPFEKTPGYERCYRTGDIVRFLEDGNLQFIGRRDMQVKIRGFRIELGEVERVIRDFPGVKQATVMAADAAAGGKCLYAYIVGEEKIDIEKLNDYIRSVKPPYMVPAATMQLESIPLTVNGKVDKRKLPKPEITFEDVTKPETKLQEKIFKLAAQVLGTEAFGIHTDLFEAGLTSLGSIRLCSLLAEAFGRPVQLRALKKYNTVAKLESFLDTAETKTAPAAHEEKAVSGEVRYGESHPISKTMEGIFTECVSKPDSTFYNIPYLIKLSEGIDEEKLKKALAAAVEAHGGMKAELFTDSEGRVCQHRRLEDTFTEKDIPTLTAESIESIKPGLVKPFPLTGARLFEIALIRADGLYLYINFHHIIADGTSMAVFIADTEKAYAGEALTPESYTGFDVAEEEQAARAGEELEEAKRYYGNLLEGLDREFLPLGDKYPEDTPASGSLVSEQLHADPAAIRRFCEQNRVGMNAFFVNAFGYVLSRYAGQEYSVFNTIYNGRNDTRAANTFAMLVKTLPVVYRREKNTAAEQISAMGMELLESMANDLFSYGEIVRAFGVTSDVMFIWQGEGFTRETFCGGKTEEIPLPLSDAKTPLSLQVMLKDGKLVYILEYDPARYTEKLMRAFISAYDMALCGFAENKNPNGISLLSPEAEAEQERYNDTEKEYDRGRTITDMFREKAAKMPEALCVAYKDTRYTYRQAWELSGKIAGFLMKNGVGAGDRVAILINRTENMLITAHGAVRAGAAYLGLDPTYPGDRLEFMIRDSGAKYLIAERGLMEKIPGYRGKVLYTDEIPSLRILTEKQEAKYRAEEKFRITPENDVLIVYSSGTTGLPKGSVLQHKAVVCFFHNYTENVGMVEGSHVATYASFGFDGGAQDVFSVPMAGASLYVIPDEIRLDLAALEKFYCENGITCGFMTTQVGTMFIANTKCRSLKHFMVGGEKFIPVMAPEWIRFQNGYGPSETMCYVNCYDIKNTGSLQPIGRVSHNIKEYIIDAEGHRLPFGACGELCISGGQMGRGYLNRPEKTEQVFVSNPFCDKPGYEKMYRTGDVVRLLPDGNYDFVGRNDGQVKIRGFRVELSEVEGQIRKFPGIGSAVVTAFDNPSGGKFLAAYIVAAEDINIEKLKAFIAAEKPEYMVPAAITRLDEIPLTSNGKVDMRKLPKPEMRSNRKGAAPADETEEKLCAIFAEVLGLEKVYADDDFFEIGGSSISAIQVIVKCDNAGFAVVYKNLFANPTAQKLSAFLHGGKQKAMVAAKAGKDDGYEYTALAGNTLPNLPKIKNNGVGDVLLTGATGFLGSHVLRELLTSTSGKVICLVRSGAGIPAEERLEMMLVYYFEDWYTDTFRSRVTVVEGDLEEEATREKLAGLKFDTIINCAANVKHFAAGDTLLGSNFTGVENLLRLAEEKQAKLIQISTVSVAGESVNGSVPAGYRFRESDLNIGQTLENKYIYSKYLAERAVIDAVSRGKVRGKIIRLGNLMARSDDSEFQVNASTNGFMRQFMGFTTLGCFPIDMMDAEVEFSPIDAVAKAVVLLSGTPDEFTVFHARNCNTIQYGYLLSAIRAKARPVEIVENAVFGERLGKALEIEANVEKLGGLLAYNNGQENGAEGEKKPTRAMIPADTLFTTKALYRLGFAWPLISREYLDNMVETLAELNFFED